MFKPACILLFSVLFTGSTYAVEYTPLEMEFEKPVTDEEFEPIKGADACQVTIAAIVDERPNKETLGRKSNKPLFSKEVSKWADTGLASLDMHGYSVNKPGASGITIEPHLYRLYSWAVQGFRIYGVVAMDVKITASNGQVISKKYRGTGSTNNGWGGDSEYVQAMNDAMSIVVQRIAKDIEPLCNSI